ncbi:MAG: MOSC domain-containing protein [Candidatus Shapirobacteria bacterium]|jgi:hypothetical protein
MKVTHLFIKKQTDSEMNLVESLTVVDLQIVGQKVSQPLRSVLITSKSLLDYWKIKPGVFRENVVIDDIDISELQSGDEIKIGEVRIRITFNCEPCGKVAHIASAGKLKKKRGVLGVFLNDGNFCIGDKLSWVQKNKHEQIPDEHFDRIKWYLKEKVTGHILAKDLLWNCGVAPGMIRALPRILDKHEIRGKDKVKYQKDIA